MDLMLRRRMMMRSKKEDDPYKDFMFGKALNPNNTLSNSDKFCVTPYYEVAISGIYTLYFGASSDTAQITIITATMQDGAYNGAYRNRQSIEWTGVNVGCFFRTSMIQANLDNCWIKDPNGDYIFKGKNVTI